MGEQRRHRKDGRTGDVLSRRALNRATLARQLLLARSDVATVDAVEHLVGLQAQAPFPPYYALWARLAGFRPGDLATPLLDRRVVRVALMRNTVHLVAARDCVALRELTQPVFDRYLRTLTAPGSALDGIDLDELAEAGRAAVLERPLTNKELGAGLGARWPEHRPASLAHGVRNLLPLVQTPPRGVWGVSGQPTLTTASGWLPVEVGAALTIDDLMLRYLGAFGPAGSRDAQTWSGLTGLREVFDRLRPRLRVFRDEQGRELFDLPDAPRPDPEIAAPVRFVAEFDNLLLSHADRTRVMTEEDRKRLFFSANGVFPGSILVDGFLHGTWRIDRYRAGTAATLTISPYRRLTKRDRAALAREGERLLVFGAADLAEHDVRFDAVD